jgi:hypothetical protein
MTSYGFAVSKDLSQLSEGAAGDRLWPNVVSAQMLSSDAFSLW